jgi:hypothetical protein
VCSASGYASNFKLYRTPSAYKAVSVAQTAYFVRPGGRTARRRRAGTPVRGTGVAPPVRSPAAQAAVCLADPSTVAADAGTTTSKLPVVADPVRYLRIFSGRVYRRRARAATIGLVRLPASWERHAIRSLIQSSKSAAPVAAADVAMASITNGLHATADIRKSLRVARSLRRSSGSRLGPGACGSRRRRLAKRQAGRLDRFAYSGHSELVV